MPSSFMILPHKGNFDRTLVQAGESDYLKIIAVQAVIAVKLSNTLQGLSLNWTAGPSIIIIN